MPRETVSSPTPAVEGDEPFAIQVGWNRDMDLQLGVVLPSGESILQRLYGNPRQLEVIGAHLRTHMAENGWPAPEWQTSDQERADLVAWGAMILEWVAAPREFYGERDGLWVELTRAMSNRVITLVRKGRDAAYGKDA